MTDEVADLVLRNNYRADARHLARPEPRASSTSRFQGRLMQDLERRGLLDRKVESLPDDAALAERQKAGQPLTRPELGVLLAFAKIALKVDLLAGGVADDDGARRRAPPLFPVEDGRSPMRRTSRPIRFAPRSSPRMIANAMINRGGPTYVLRVGERTGAAPIDIARAYVDGPRHLRPRGAERRDRRARQPVPGHGAARALSRGAGPAPDADGLVPPERRLRRRASRRWSPPMARTVARPRRRCSTACSRRVSARSWRRPRRGSRRRACPPMLAARIAMLPALAAATDIHLVADATGAPLAEVAPLFFEHRRRLRHRADRPPGAWRCRRATTMTASPATGRWRRSSSPTGGSRSR